MVAGGGGGGGGWRILCWRGEGEISQDRGTDGRLRGVGWVELGVIGRWRMVEVWGGEAGRFLSVQN